MVLIKGRDLVPILSWRGGNYSSRIVQVCDYLNFDKKNQGKLVT